MLESKATIPTIWAVESDYYDARNRVHLAAAGERGGGKYGRGTKLLCGRTLKWGYVFRAYNFFTAYKDQACESCLKRAMK